MTTDLRHFEDEDDLFDNVENTTILRWVNDLHERKTAQSAQGKRYRVKQQMFAKVAMQRLDPDEVKRVVAAAMEKAEEGEG